MSNKFVSIRFPATGAVGTCPLDSLGIWLSRGWEQITADDAPYFSEHPANLERNMFLVDIVEERGAHMGNVYPRGGTVVLSGGRLLRASWEDDDNVTIWSIVDTRNRVATDIDIDMGPGGGPGAFVRGGMTHVPEWGYIVLGIADEANGGAGPWGSRVVLLDDDTLDFVASHDLSDVFATNPNHDITIHQVAASPNRRIVYATLNEWNTGAEALVALNVASNGTITRGSVRTTTVPSSPTVAYSRAIDRVGLFSLDTAPNGLQICHPVTLADDGAFITNNRKAYHPVAVGGRFVTTDHGSVTPKGISFYDLWARTATQLNLLDKQFPTSGGLLEASQFTFNPERNLLYVSAYTNPASDTRMACMWAVNVDTQRVEDYLELPMPHPTRPIVRDSYIAFDPATGLTFVTQRHQPVGLADSRIVTYAVR